MTKQQLASIHELISLVKIQFPSSLCLGKDMNTELYSPPHHTHCISQQWCKNQKWMRFFRRCRCCSWIALESAHSLVRSLARSVIHSCLHWHASSLLVSSYSAVHKGIHFISKPWNTWWLDWGKILFMHVFPRTMKLTFSSNHPTQPTPNLPLPNGHVGTTTIFSKSFFHLNTAWQRNEIAIAWNEYFKI